MKKGSGTKIIAIAAVLLAGFFGGPVHTFGNAILNRDPEQTEMPTDQIKLQEQAPELPEQTELPAEPEEPPAPEYFTLNFVGDCTLASAPGFQGGANGYDTITGGDVNYPFAETVQYFTDDDFTMANCECCFTQSNNATAKTFTFKTDASYADVFPAGSVEFVTLANNHVRDYGLEGYDDTKAALDDVGVGYAGRDEWTVYETERGLKIGVYAVSFGSVDQIKTGIAAVKDAGAEFIIAALHFGDEGSYQVNADQKAQAHAAIDAGADFVYGSHPHTLQPMEEYNGGLITYSMGNWSFGGNTNPRDKDTFFLRLQVCRDAEGNISISEYSVTPCACSGETSFNNYQPVVYDKDTDSEAYQRVLSKLDGTFTGENLSIGYSYSANE